MPSQRSTALRAGGTAATPPPTTRDRERDGPRGPEGATPPRTSLHARAHAPRSHRASGGHSTRSSARRVSSSLAQLLLQARERARQTRLTVPGRQPSAAAVSRSDQIQQVAAGDGRSLLLPQRGDGREERFVLLGGEEHALGGRGRVGGGALPAGCSSNRARRDDERRRLRASLATIARSQGRKGAPAGSGRARGAP